MKLLRLLFILIFSAVVLEAYGIEPSTQIVIRNGKKVYVHKVEKGHTLYSIAKAYGVEEKSIIDHNEGLSPATLRVGDIIFVPCVEKKNSSRRNARKEEAPDGKYYIHEVAEGDTFYSIARQYKISVDILREDNPDVDPAKLSIGTELRIRRSEVGYATTNEIDAAEHTSAEQALKPNEHVVQPGETIYSLSRRAGLSEREFMALNRLRTPQDLKAGMVVLLSSNIVEQAEPETLPEDASAEEAAEVVETTEVADDMAESTAVQRERLSGRTDDDPVVEEKSPFAWFIFGGDNKERRSFRYADVDFMELGRQNTLKVALMLPFHINGEAQTSYVDFYRGVLLAMEDLKAEGHSIDLTVFDTQNDARIINDIVTYEDAFLDAQLLIGPVFEDELQYVVSHAERENVAVVSPLANMVSLRTPVLFQMQPKRSHKYDKLKDILGDEREIITIYASSSNDNEFVREVHDAVTSTKRRELIYLFDRGSYFYTRTSSGGRGASVDIEALLRERNDKTFIIVADEGVDIDRILTTLSSAKSKLQDRGAVIGRYDVVGNYKWTRLKNVDVQSFFKNNVSLIVSYHAKRSDEVIRLFDGRYIDTYNALPSPFSYRGYDAAMIFCRRMYSGLDTDFIGETFMPLTTSYRFVSENGLNVNSEWMLVRYNDDFTITAM